MPYVSLVAAFIDPQWFTPSIIVLILGSILFLLGITGGGAEIKEITIPKVEGAWRLTAFLSGILLVLFGSLVLGRTSNSQGSPKSEPEKQAVPAKTEPPKQTEPPKEQVANENTPEQPGKKVAETSDSSDSKPLSSDVPAPRNVPGRKQIVVVDDMADDLMWEVVDLKIGGSAWVRFSVSKEHPHASASFDVPSSGNVNYSLKVTEKAGPKGYIGKPAQTVGTFSGAGRISAEDKLQFEVWGETEPKTDQYLVYITPNRGHVP